MRGGCPLVQGQQHTAWCLAQLQQLQYPHCFQPRIQRPALQPACPGPHSCLASQHLLQAPPSPQCPPCCVMGSSSPASLGSGCQPGLEPAQATAQHLQARWPQGPLASVGNDVHGSPWEPGGWQRLPWSLLAQPAQPPHSCTPRDIRLLLGAHLLGERRRRTRQKLRDRESEGSSGRGRQFSLIWANPLPAEWSQNLTKKKKSFPASHELGTGFPQPALQRHRETCTTATSKLGEARAGGNLRA